MRYLLHWIVGGLMLWALGACQDPDYNAEAYVSFGSVDELAAEMLKSIQARDADQMLRLMDNQQVVQDLLAKAQGDDVTDLKQRLDTKEGQRRLSVERFAKKQRINAFLTDGLPKELEENLKQLRSSGVVFAQEHPFAEGSPAKLQGYVLHLSTLESGGYTYDFTVIYWNGYYHLIEVAGFLNKL